MQEMVVVVLTEGAVVVFAVEWVGMRSGAGVTVKIMEGTVSKWEETLGR